MKLFSLKTLSTAIMLSSTILLSACGGSSDSSGGEYEFKDKSKIDILNGYWQSNCQRSDDGSAFLYLALTEVNDNTLAMNGKVQVFPNKDCTGNKFTVKTKNQAKKITKKDLEADQSIKIIDNKHWKDIQDNEIFTRISESEYNKVK